MKRILHWAARKWLWVAASLLCSTLRIKRSDAAFFDDYVAGKRPGVIAFWHGSMLLGWYLHRALNGRRVAALVSRSDDGEILASILGHWRYELIRGSSHVGGKEAMQLMVDALNGGASLCVTPDGPVGPRHQMKMGAVRSAQRTRVPLFLVGIAAERKKELRSWDRFEIPMPFSKVSVRYSEPVLVPEELRDQALDDFLAATQHQLQVLSKKAEGDFSEL